MEVEEAEGQAGARWASGARAERVVMAPKVKAPPVAADCAACPLPILWLTEETADSGDTLSTSVFIGEYERRLHWRCFEAEQQEAQARMFG
jgi:hypothetical protein